MKFYVCQIKNGWIITIKNYGCSPLKEPYSSFEDKIFVEKLEDLPKLIEKFIIEKTS